MKEALDEMKEWFDSDVGIAYIERIKQIDTIKDMQLERLYNSNKFVELTEKAIAKYDSAVYIDKWYRRGIEPPNELLWFLLDYTVKYGRECTSDEVEKYANIFTSNMLYCDGYYFNRMDGQGSIIRVTKEV